MKDDLIERARQHLQQADRDMNGGLFSSDALISDLVAALSAERAAREAAQRDAERYRELKRRVALPAGHKHRLEVRDWRSPSIHDLDVELLAARGSHEA